MMLKEQVMTFSGVSASFYFPWKVIGNGGKSWRGSCCNGDCVASPSGWLTCVLSE